MSQRPIRENFLRISLNIQIETDCVSHLALKFLSDASAVAACDWIFPPCLFLTLF